MLDLEERLRRAAELLDDAANIPLLLDGPTDDRLAIAGPFGRQAARPRNTGTLVRVAACLVGLIGLVGIASVATRGGPGAPAAQPAATSPAGVVTTSGLSAPAASAAPTTAPSDSLVPAGTLPPAVDVSSSVPPTVVGTGPTDWYRLQPDLDVAWYSDGAGTASMLCFRTPAGGPECQLDEFAPTANGGGPIAVRSVGDQFLIVTLDPVATVTVAFDDGQVAAAPVQVDPQIGWRVARVALPLGASSPIAMSAIFAMAFPSATTVPETAAATHPPATSGVASATETTAPATTPTAP